MIPAVNLLQSEGCGLAGGDAAALGGRRGGKVGDARSIENVVAADAEGPAN
jgi:hypothetical protein